MSSSHPASELPAALRTRELPGGFWSKVWPLIVAGFISALLLRACVLAPATPLPAGFSPEQATEDANSGAMRALARLRPGSSTAAVLAAANLVVVNFASGSDVVPVSAEPALAALAQALLYLPETMRVEIAGHTDSVGQPLANIKLGRARAWAVRDALASYGFPADRIVVVSYGDARPIADNRSEEGRYRNRRIEFSLAL